MDMIRANENLEPAACQKILDAALRVFVKTGQRNLLISDLARQAGIARGTVYNNFPNDADFFELVSTSVADDMHRHFERLHARLDSPHERVAAMMLSLVRRSHDDPALGRFVMMFAPGSHVLRAIWAGTFASELDAAVQAGTFTEPPDRAAAITLISGAVFAFVFLVVEGHRTWRRSGSLLIHHVFAMLGAPPDLAAPVARRIIARMARG